MALFKYVRPERTDVIDRCEIRFTQPGALNDPFEFRPQFESLFAEAEALAKLAAEPSDFEPMLRQAYAMLSEEQRSRLPYQPAAQIARASMATGMARSRASASVLAFLQSMNDGAPQIREEIYKALNTSVGILSLSEVPDNEIMWAHYADRHTGMVLGFDGTHTFFNRRRSESDEFYFLRKVLYKDTAPAPSLGSLDGEFFVTKGSRWAYEREWRMLLPLKDATRSITTAGDTVHLFTFPSDALKYIVIGANATPTLEASVRELLSTSQVLSNVGLSRATLDHNQRRVRVPWPPPGSAS
jgi:hypothetical protein